MISALSESCLGGEDDCNEYPVTIQHLKSLLSVLTQVDEDHSKASFLLPTRSGFFFGGTQYDECYFGDVKQTVQLISDTIKNYPDDTIFKYQSSW